MVFFADFSCFGDCKSGHNRPNYFINQDGAENNGCNNFGIERKRHLALKSKPNGHAGMGNERYTQISLNNGGRTKALGSKPGPNHLSDYSGDRVSDAA
jgi:hypothetical protein